MQKKVVYSIIGWAAVAAAVVGPFLPWMHRTSAAKETYELFFSSVSRPNWEWLLWFAAPLGAGLLAAKRLVVRSRVGLATLLPCAVFLIAWAALLLTGYRAYTGFRQPGFALTFVGVVGLTALAVINVPDTNTGGR